MIPEKNPEAKQRETQGRAQESHREEPRSRNKTQNLSVNPRPPRTGAYSTPHVCGREAVPPQPRCHCADGYGVMPGVNPMPLRSDGEVAMPPQPGCLCADGYGVMPGSCPDAALIQMPKC